MSREGQPERSRFGGSDQRIAERIKAMMRGELDEELAQNEQLARQRHRRSTAFDGNRPLGRSNGR